jgi:hypothetical protein
MYSNKPSQEETSKSINRVVRFLSSISSDILGFIIFAAVLVAILTMILLSINLTIWTCTVALAIFGLANKTIALGNLLGLFLLILLLVSAKSLWAWAKWHWKLSSDENNVDKSVTKE